MGCAKGDSQPAHATNSRHLILVVEDEVFLRMSLAHQLREAGYMVIEASGLREALDVLTQSPDVRVVITDVHMDSPTSGLQLAQAVRSAYPAIKVVLTSSEPVGQVEHDGFFPKPYIYTQIVNYIKTLLG